MEGNKDKNDSTCNSLQTSFITITLEQIPKQRVMKLGIV